MKLCDQMGITQTEFQKDMIEILLGDDRLDPYSIGIYNGIDQIPIDARLDSQTGKQHIRTDQITALLTNVVHSVLGVIDKEVFVKIPNKFLFLSAADQPDNVCLQVWSFRY